MRLHQMPDNNIKYRHTIQKALQEFPEKSLNVAATDLLTVLGYTSEKTTDLGNDVDTLLGNIETFSPELGKVDRSKVSSTEWKQCAFLFQLTNDEIPSLASGQTVLTSERELARGQIESFVFLAIELNGDNWSRTALSAIARELNRRFPMPVILLFVYGGLFSLAVIDRRLNLKDPSRDVINNRITVIKDVRLERSHPAHLDILSGLVLENLGEKRRPSNFRDLYHAWIEALSIQELNKRFYNELQYWYIWAIKQVEFPLGGGKDRGKRNSVAVIRLLTRLIFVWFVREKSLVPDALFDRDKLKELLKSDPAAKPDDSTYYLAILQNLFFATLNVEMGKKRKWANHNPGMKGDRLIHTIYRHRELFKRPDTAIKLFADIPFLNGGLFECLDRELSERDFERNPELKELATKEGRGWVLRVDGFSRRKDAQPMVPNRIFFGGAEHVDLSDELGAKVKDNAVFGLLDIFARYKFTVDENTPLEEEVALDPELLGKVFENLLASYNEDTKTTARKQSGSFYTPREVVDYMVDETLIACFERHLPESKDREQRLRDLLSYSNEGDTFLAAEAKKLIAAIEGLKILDPACGSGAFPMGMLAKLVHVLQKLDPDNRLWRERNRTPLQAQLADAEKIPAPVLRDEKIEEAQAALEKFDRDFANDCHADYTRKLYLIEKCIYGVDIQPIAVQITKLRFFIALIVSQEVDIKKDNRGITALPNLETKIIAADSLMPIERQQGGLTQTMSLRDPAIDAKEKELTEANEHYFAARTSKTKGKWRDRIFDLRDELAELLEQDRFLPEGSARQLVHWNPFDQNAAADFFDPEWMFQLSEGFDITMGNPPYVRQEQIKHLKEKFKKIYDCYTGTADLYVYFYERAIKLLKPGGAFAFITSNKWYRAKYGTKLRGWINRNTLLRSIIDFGDEAVFTAIAYPTIVIAIRRKDEVKQPAADDTVQVLNWVGEQPVESFPAVFSEMSFPLPLTELGGDVWQLESSTNRRLLDRIRSGGIALSEYIGARVYRGITTGLNDAFVIDSPTRDRLIEEDPSSVEIIKPYLRGQDVKRWSAKSQNLWLIFTRRGININQYPAVLKYITAFKTQLEPKPRGWDEKQNGKWLGRKAGSYEWFEIQDNIAYWQEFEKTKIISTKVSIQPTFILDNTGWYLSNTAYFIPVKEDSLYLLALLNSNVSGFYAKRVFVDKQSGWYEVQPTALEAFPIPNADLRQRHVLGGAAHAVLAAGDPRYEQLINGLVYELFFTDDLHQTNIHLFDECKKASLARLAKLEGDGLVEAANELADKVFAADHPIYAMLFDLQALDVVRIIEGHE